MKLAVFGASGRTGRPFVRQALGAGHEATAFVRDAEKLDGDVRDHDRVTVVEGDVCDAEAVAEAIEGADAVVSVLGHAEGSPDDVLTLAADHVLRGMERAGVSRLLWLSGAGVRTGKDPERTLGGRLMTGALKLVGGDLLADSKRAVERIVDSDTEWTVVRAPRLTDGERRGEYRTGYLQLGPRDSLSRADAADFLLRCAVEGEWTNEAPMASY
ncbi:NAD(P)-dependent oxidoreductase [Halobium salinum]|uniref:NAD(P)-dependent oxidoreductase n=1 Tax=Halobium salinum TaxID=1364940 RepID=A0ABD5PE69_9EURY|nr:NAD(P)H-binding protein [Halobium salinum]